VAARGLDPKLVAARQRARLTAPRADSLTALFGGAQQLVSTVVMDERAADYLFTKSRCAGMSREQWENEIRLTTAIYQTLRASRRTLAWEQAVDVQALDEAFARLRSAPNASRGTLLLTFHGPFAPLVQELFKRRCQAGAILGGGREDRGEVRMFDSRKGSWTFTKSGDALFEALNILRDGNLLLMAPDGWKGKRSEEFHVLGGTAAGRGGAAFLAHASGCNTAWYNFARDGGRFSPVIESGPARADGEYPAAFSQRLHDFFASRIEDVFTGDPRNIMLFGRWAQCFALAAKTQGGRGA
jgi:hypothetical protein